MAACEDCGTVTGLAAGELCDDCLVERALDGSAEESDEEPWRRCTSCGVDRVGNDDKDGVCWLCRKQSTPEYQAERRQKAASDKRSTVIACCVIAAIIGWFVMQGINDANETRKFSRIGAVCEDGSRTSATGNGACSGHGGVEEWMYEDIPDSGNEYQPAP